MPTTNTPYVGALWSHQRAVPRIVDPLDYAQVAAAVEAVSGWLLPEETQWLYRAARDLAPAGGTIVELGSFCGKSTIALAAGAMARNFMVNAIDTFEGTAELEALGLNTFDEFRTNVAAAGVGARVQPIRALTTDAARDFHEHISLLFIDADHSYNGVRADFSAWFPKVVPNGLVAFHDTTWPGPQRLVHEAVYGKLRDAQRIGTIVWARKAPARVTDHVRAWSEDALRGGRARALLRRVPGPVKRLVKR